MLSRPTQHSIEPELLLAAPRPVRLRSARTPYYAAYQVLTWPLVVLAAALTVKSCLGLLVLNRGIPVMATVTQQYKTYGLPNLAGKHPTTFHVAYSYIVDGTVFTEDAPVTSAEYLCAPAGTQLAVLVSPLWPGRESVPLFYGERDTLELHSLIPEALVLDVLALIFFWTGFYCPMQMRQLVSRGVPTIGNIADKKLIQGKIALYQVTYDYSDANLRPRQLTAEEALENPYALLTSYGTSTIRKKVFVDKRTWSNALPGDRITVLFSAEAPQQSVIYRYCDYEVSV